MRLPVAWLPFGLACLIAPAVQADDVKETELFARIKASIDSVRAVDSHSHLNPFDQIMFRDETDRGVNVTLRSIWAGSYYPWVHPLEPWPKGGSFDAWWSKARHNFGNARAASFYRYLLPAFRDLYQVDFDTITASEARKLNERIVANYQDDRWLREVVTKRANIELMLVDPFWARLDVRPRYPFTVRVLNISSLVRGFHPSEFNHPLDDPYRFARKHELPVKSLDDYLVVLDRLCQDAKQSGTVALKNVLAYERTLRFDRVPNERAAVAFGRPRGELTSEEIKDFEDFIMWRLAALSAKHDLPFQIHTGHARIQGSNPMLLVELINANPKTKFVLLHGGFPWVSEAGLIAMRSPNVWLDSVWLPTLSYSIAKRSYQQWLEMIPSNRIMWGSDTFQAEGVYGATEFTRQCLAEALAEKVQRGELREEHAIRIGTQIMRENALELFPRLRQRLDGSSKPNVPEENP